MTVSESNEPVIFAKRFRESCVGKRFAQTKIKTEYSIVVEYSYEVNIEIINSRLSRKKVIRMDDNIVEKFKRINTNDLRYSWTHSVGGAVVVFSICPNVHGSGTDLLVNGRDFFSYVFKVDENNPLGYSKSSFDIQMDFKVPSVYKPIDSNSPQCRMKFITMSEPRPLNLIETSSPLKKPGGGVTGNTSYYNLDDTDD